MRIGWLTALCAVFFATSAQAYCPDDVTEKTEVRTLVECVKDLRPDWPKVTAALNAYRNFLADPVSIIDTVDLEPVRTNTAGLGIVLSTMHYELHERLAPDRNTSGLVDPFRPFRHLLGTPENLRKWFNVAKPAIMRAVNRVSIAGAIQKYGDELTPLINKRADALLAQAGMLWLYSDRCLDEETKESAACREHRFPAEFESYYGIKPTHQSVWILGFLNRRDLERRGLSDVYRELGLELVKMVSTGQ